jgi:hypothetical protein
MNIETDPTQRGINAETLTGNNKIEPVQSSLAGIKSNAAPGNGGRVFLFQVQLGKI